MISCLKNGNEISHIADNDLFMKTQFQAAFTLMELLVAISVLAVITGIAAPSMSTIIEANRIESGVQAIFTSLITARSEAISRNQSVIVCKSSNGTSCTTSGEWEQGWVIVVDENVNGVQDSGEPVTSSFGSLEYGLTLRAGVAYADKVRFSPEGTAFDADTFRLCPADSDIDDARSIVMTITGRPRTSEGSTACP